MSNLLGQPGRVEIQASDFQTVMAKEHQTPAQRLVLAKRPSFENIS